MIVKAWLVDMMRESFCVHFFTNLNNDRLNAQYELLTPALRFPNSLRPKIIKEAHEFAEGAKILLRDTNVSSGILFASSPVSYSIQITKNKAIKRLNDLNIGLSNWLHAFIVFNYI